MTDMRPVFRFAPSPNGALHLGHAYSALFSAAMARRCGGRFLLRIEDIDTARCRPEYEAAIREDLAWLGLTWEEPVRRQSEHLSSYAAAVGKLRARGLLYPCFASRKDIAEAVERPGAPIEHDPDGAPLYPGLYRDADAAETAKRIEAGEPFALRLDMARARAVAFAQTGGQLFFDSFDESGRVERVAAHPERWGDVVLSGKDRPATYHIAVVIDDALQGVSHVTRGADLLAATGIHRLLQVLLDLPAPLYHHHRLILDETGRKLSKSHRDTSLAALRADGVSAQAIRARLGLAGSG